MHPERLRQAARFVAMNRACESHGSFRALCRLGRV
jgi:hypothetical protein